MHLMTESRVGVAAVILLGALGAFAARNLDQSKVDPRYFADAQGRTFVPVGCNICFPRMYVEGNILPDFTRSVVVKASKP